MTDCTNVKEVHDNRYDANHSLVYCSCGPCCPPSLSRVREGRRERERGRRGREERREGREGEAGREGRREGGREGVQKDGKEI